MKTKYLKEYFFFPDILIMMVLLFASFIGMMLHANHLGVWLAFGLGMIAYTFIEYMTHRFLFHMKTPKHPILLQLIKRLHYDHHSSPNDLKLLFLPVWYSLPNILVAGAICYTLTRSWMMTNAFLGGVILFLLFYEWKHYIAHRPVKPVTRFGIWMKKVHLLHHFKNENYWFGVTNMMYDKAFGTYKEEKEAEKSETARQLEQRK